MTQQWLKSRLLGMNDTHTYVSLRTSTCMCIERAGHCSPAPLCLLSLCVCLCWCICALQVLQSTAVSAMFRTGCFPCQTCRCGTLAAGSWPAASQGASCNRRQVSGPWQQQQQQQQQQHRAAAAVAAMQSSMFWTLGCLRTRASRASRDNLMAAGGSSSSSSSSSFLVSVKPVSATQP